MLRGLTLSQQRALVDTGQTIAVPADDDAEDGDTFDAAKFTEDITAYREKRKRKAPSDAAAPSPRKHGRRDDAETEAAAQSIMGVEVRFLGVVVAIADDPPPPTPCISARPFFLLSLN